MKKEWRCFPARQSGSCRFLGTSVFSRQFIRREAAWTDAWPEGGHGRGVGPLFPPVFGIGFSMFRLFRRAVTGAALKRLRAGFFRDEPAGALPVRFCQTGRLRGNPLALGGKTRESLFWQPAIR
ncbi:hypothetical protein [Oxalobacter paraformigenes]|uniref:hypothetical protein n=1 Tax=Oxalobacter paraformigenes TaxID=556268 RepID=UPI00059339D7|nr:hypothetical protein [Oxalobacter paraformigenes]